jgi:hypothetical protein
MSTQVSPITEGIGNKTCIGIPWIPGHLLPQPIRSLENLVFLFQFDFRNDETRVFSQELVNFPSEALEHDNMPDLFNDTSIALLQQLFSVSDRDLVFELWL